jgi:hypothetical protein
MRQALAADILELIDRAAEWHLFDSRPEIFRYNLFAAFRINPTSIACLRC